MWRRFLFCVSLSVACLCPLSAHAQVSPLAESLTGESKEAYELGKKLFETKDYSGAASKFSTAYKLSSDYRLLRNVAACERELLHYAKAYSLLTRYLEGGAGKLSAEQVAATESTRTALRGLFSMVATAITPAGARVFLDGEDLGLAPLEPFAVDLGNHGLRVEFAGFETLERAIDVPGRTDLRLKLTMKKRAVAMAKLSVATSPDAAIAIDGKTVGLGYYLTDIDPGSYQVSVTAEGKEPYSTKVELEPGVSRALDVKLVPARGPIPTWAWIAGGTLLAGGLTVGGYFLFRSKEEPRAVAPGALDTVYLKLGARF